jgi:hypothetical protein
MHNNIHALNLNGYIYPNKLNLKKNNYLAMLFAFVLNLVLFFLFLSINLFGQTSGGGYSESYLLRDVGARALAMAGAYTATANDPSAIFYNPAGIASLSNVPTANISVSSLGYNRSYSNLAWAQSINENFGIGIGINGMTNGSFVGRNNKGQEIGNYNDLQYTMGVTAAYKKESVSIGITAKYLKHNLQNSGLYADGAAIDIGTKFNVMNAFSFGLAVQNIGGTMAWNTRKYNNDPIPFTVRSGVAMEFGFNDEFYKTRSSASGDMEENYVPATKYLLVGIDAVMNQHEKSPNFVLGFEAIVHEAIGFRGGITLYGEDKGVTKILPMTKWGGGVTIRPDIKSIPFKTHIDYTVFSEPLIDSQIGHNVTFYIEF